MFMPFVSHPVDDDPTRLLGYRDSIYAADLLLCAVAHFDIFTYLQASPRTLPEICMGLGMEPRPAEVLMSLLLALDLVRAVDRRYQPTDLARTYLVSGRPDSLVPYYRSLEDRPQCLEFRDVLRTGKPAGWSSRKGGDDWLGSMRQTAFADRFTAAMDSRGAFLARELAEKLALAGYVAGYKSLLDVAGGSGVYACTIAQLHPRLRAAVFEIPPVDDAARRSLAVKGMSGRVEVLAGDMFQSLPAGFDVHLFANVFHDWDEESLAKLATASYRSLGEGGAIVVFDAHLHEGKDGPLSVAEYSCLLMHSTPGRCYSTREIGDILGAAGFGGLEVLEIAAERTALIARK